MGNLPFWLPPLVKLSEYEGDWKKYVEALYSFFKQDFIDNKPKFKGRQIRLKKYPIECGKEATFWHFISEGSKERERLPDFRRCERIQWPKPIIEMVSDRSIKLWSNNRRGEKRFVLWLGKAEYLVVLADRKEYVIPWTAYIVTKDRQKRKLMKEYESYKNTEAALKKN